MESNSAVVEAEARLTLLWLLLRRCSRAAVRLFPALLFPVLLFPVLVSLSLMLVLMPALAGLMMIRCSGLLMGRWMFLRGWPGLRRSWRR